MTSGPKKVLIVEDEKAIAGALSLKLSSSGFDVSVVSNGQEAVEIVDREKFDIILLDLVMPKMNGFDFLKNIRAKGINSPVIVLSNLSQEQDMKKAQELGADDYFVKSNVSLAEIVRRIERLLV